jgi:tRNA dimethylallyltransferase
MNKLVIICGPTATGKTDIAIQMAQKFNGELVAADSRQVYRGMDIGTGKDKKALQGIHIWMYDVVCPDEAFSVSQYQKKAQGYIKDIQKRNKLPIVVGGTGLYIQSFVQTIPTEGVKPNIKLRQELEEQPLEKLQHLMKKKYVHMWETLNDSDKNNPRRLIRKIEIGRAGIKIIKKPDFHTNNVCWIGLTAPFPYIYKKIDKRVEKRVGQGVTNEIRALLKRGYGWDLPSMSGLGYREWKEYVDGNTTMEAVIQKWKYDEHGYARRQMTWFKRNKDIHWFDITHSGYREDIELLIGSWYTK